MYTVSVLCRKKNGGAMVVPFTKAGVIVVVVGHTPCMNGEGSQLLMYLCTYMHAYHFLNQLVSEVHTTV